MRAEHAITSDAMHTTAPVWRKFRQAVSTTIMHLGVLPGRDDGIATAVGMLVLATLTLLGTTGIMITATDLKIGGAHKASEAAFYAAEAGLEEARGRLLRDRLIAAVQLHAKTAGGGIRGGQP